MLAALAAIAPGRPVRDGLDRILRARAGALVILGDGPDVLRIRSGGFLVDTDFSPQRLSELAKMDGAMILSSDATRIARANVHLVPDPALVTTETGTRHRTAERVARSIDVPVVAVSEDMSTITIYRHGQKRVLQPIPQLLSRANQALATLERYRTRLDTVSASLTALEVEDLATVMDVGIVVQRHEMVSRIAQEIQGYLIELGVDGRLLRLQLVELMAGVDNSYELVLADYCPESHGPDVARHRLSALDNDELLNLDQVVQAATVRGWDSLDAPVHPRGLRVASRIPRIDAGLVRRIVDAFGDLKSILRATDEDFMTKLGLETDSAVNLRESLSRLAETSILEQYS